jgi:hypothetical protein
VKLRLKILIYTIRFIGIYAPLEEKNRETRGFYDNLKVAVEKTIKVTIIYWLDILMLQMGLN